jgi:hypothetical protein
MLRILRSLNSNDLIRDEKFHSIEHFRVSGSDWLVKRERKEKLGTRYSQLLKWKFILNWFTYCFSCVSFNGLEEIRKFPIHKFYSV